MTCPECFGKTTVQKTEEIAVDYVDQVDHFEMVGYIIRRLRKCPSCGLHFTTIEKREEKKRKCTSG